MRGLKVGATAIRGLPLLFNHQKQNEDGRNTESNGNSVTYF